MAILSLPDPLEAIIDLLLDTTEFTNVVGQQVGDGLDDSWTMPGKAVILRYASGPPGTPSSHFMRSRVDALCYGASSREASQVYRILDPCICPGQEREASFTRLGCRIDSIDRERAASSDIELGTNFFRVTCSYVVTWLGLPV